MGKGKGAECRDSAFQKRTIMGGGKGGREMAAFENPSRARSTINPAEIRKRRLKPNSRIQPLLEPRRFYHNQGRPCLLQVTFPRSRRTHFSTIADRSREGRERFLHDSRVNGRGVTFGPRGFRCSFDNAIQEWQRYSEYIRVLRLKEETSGFEAFQSFISHRRLDGARIG